MQKNCRLETPDRIKLESAATNFKTHLNNFLVTTESCYEQTLQTDYLDLPPTLGDSFHISMKKTQ